MEDSFFRHRSHADARLTLARDNNQPAEIVARLSGAPEIVVRQTIAAHPNISAVTLRKLANDRDPYTRLQVANNPKTESKTLLRLTKDVTDFVAEAAFKQLERRL